MIGTSAKDSPLTGNSLAQKMLVEIPCKSSIIRKYEVTLKDHNSKNLHPILLFKKPKDAPDLPLQDVCSVSRRAPFKKKLWRFEFCLKYLVKPVLLGKLRPPMGNALTHKNFERI